MANNFVFIYFFHSFYCISQSRYVSWLSLVFLYELTRMFWIFGMEFKVPKFTFRWKFSRGSGLDWNLKREIYIYQLYFIILQEFIDAIHQFAGQSPEDKIKFLFKVYDLDGKYIKSIILKYLTYKISENNYLFTIRDSILLNVNAFKSS